MAELTFHGGIHPKDGKVLSKDRAVQTLFPQNGEMVFPLVQNIGRPAVPIVNVGERVRTGQLIAVANGELSANLHSSVSGRVLAMERRPMADGQLLTSLIIDNDGLYLEMDYPQDRGLESLDRDMVLSKIQEAGVVGMGGAGMPTHYKLMHCDPAKIDTVIANCVECEPYLTSDYRRVLENPWKIINGLMILLAIFPYARGFIAISDKNEEGYHILRELLKDNSRIFVKKCKDKYPQGSERQLIYALTGRTLNARMLPGDIGCIVNNADTLVAVNQAVIMHEPLITRIITVSGNAAASPGNFRVRIGMSYRDLLEQAGGLAEGIRPEDVIFIDGGPMTGQVMNNIDVPITKMSSGITIMTRDSFPARPASPCTRCGRCVEVCPNHLMPLFLKEDTRRHNSRQFIRRGGLECCDCGSCSYICPSGIQLSSSIYGQKRRIMRDPRLAGEYTRRFMR